MQNEREPQKIYCRGCGETMIVKAGDRFPERCDLCGEPLHTDRAAHPVPPGIPPPERSA